MVVDVLRGIVAAALDPVGVELELHQRLVRALNQDVHPAPAALDRLELERVIVIEKRKPFIPRLPGQLVEPPGRLAIIVHRAAERFRQRRHDEPRAADGAVEFRLPRKISLELFQPDMRSHHRHAALAQHAFPFLRIPAVVAGEFDAIVTHRAHAPDGTLGVVGSLTPDTVELEGKGGIVLRHGGRGRRVAQRGQAIFVAGRSKRGSG